ncbi:MAG: DUF309 domain-containing protein [Chloroflexi bacterium]|nr:DUF309 domain-containing protein [Chloroflexota bacterium]
MNEIEKPIIVGFTADLMFSSKIQNVANATGFRMKWVESAAELGEMDSNEKIRGERLHGREGQLFQKMAAWQPVLLLFDLTNQAIPWEKWLPLLKTSSATRRIPIIAFGPHTDVDIFQTAKSRGADAVYARSRFFGNMPHLLQKHARLPDSEALADICAEPLAALALTGIALFNQGEYYKCHDALEEAWKQDTTPGRNLYRGVLQYSIALYQIEQSNYRGAVKMLLRVRQWLDPLPVVCRSVNVARLRENIQLTADKVQELGEDGLVTFDFTAVLPIEIIE